MFGGNMFTTYNMLLFIISGIIGIFTLAFYVFASKRWRIKDYRCPGCNFLVTAKDVEHYGHICPDCKTDWRIHPLKNDDGEEVESEIVDEDQELKAESYGSPKKRLVR